MVVRWHKTAMNDLKEFFEVTKLNNPKDYIQQLISYVNNLSEQPNLGKIYLYIHGFIIRQLIYKDHKIFYYNDNENNQINVLSVVHYRQDIKKKINYIKKYL